MASMLLIIWTTGTSLAALMNQEVFALMSGTVIFLVAYF